MLRYSYTYKQKRPLTCYRHYSNSFLGFAYHASSCSAVFKNVNLSFGTQTKCRHTRFKEVSIFTLVSMQTCESSPPAGYSIFLLSELHTKNILKTYSGGTTEMFQGVKYIHIWRLAGKTQNDTEGACKIEICALLSLLCRHRRPPDSGRCFSADRSMLIKIGCDSDCGLMEAKREKERGNFRDDDWKNEKWLLFPGVMESYCMRARKANTSTSSSPFSNR